MVTPLRRLIAACLIVSLSGITIPSPVQAGMLSTEAVVSTAERDRIAHFLDRPEARSALKAYGVNPEDAKARVAALTNDEAAQLAARIDTLPAGGDALGTIVWVALVVFIVLLITDLLGFTHVFPFVKPVR